mgnify:FL=1
MKRIFEEIDQFKKIQSVLKREGFSIDHIDEYGFTICGNHQSERIDLLITGLVHGNEVIGIEVINRVLKRVVKNNEININLGFLLCNIEAAQKNTRFVESDLNRSFSTKEIVTLEQRRASEIAKIVDQTDFIFDLHQTVEPSLTPFFVMEHRHELIQIANQLLPQFPIVTFGAGVVCTHVD